MNAQLDHGATNTWLDNTCTRVVVAYSNVGPFTLNS